MAVTSAPQAMPPQHLWDPKAKSAHLKIALWKSESPSAFLKHVKYFILGCNECLFAVVYC